MTDAEMIKLLRNSPFTFNDIVADRIEELDEELVLAQDATNHWIIAYNNIEAKLAKAVEVLHQISLASQNIGTTKESLGREARSVLEELENYNG